MRHISKTTARVIETSLIALLVFTPLARGAVQPWAVSIAHFLTFIMVTTYLLGVVFGAQPRPGRTPLDLPLVALFLLALFSSLFSIERHSSVVALARLAHYVALYVIVVNTVRRRDQVRRLAYTIVAVGSFLALFGLIKYLGGLTPPWWDYDVQSAGLTATFVNKNHLAGYMEMAIPVAAGLLLAARRGWEKALFAFSIFLLCVALTLSLSRGGWISATFALGLMCCLYLMKAKRHYKGLMVGAVSVATVVVLTALASAPVVGRLETLTHGEDMGKRQGRPALWAKTLDLIEDHAVLGTGPGTFPIAFTPYRPAGVNSTYQYAHNDYLHFVSETGLFTLGIMLWLVAAFFPWATAKIKATKSELTLGITLGALSGMVAIMVHSLVDFNLHIMANATLFTVLAGLVMSPAHGPWTAGRSPLRFPLSAATTMPVVKTALTVTMVGLFALGSHFLYRWFMGDYFIHRAKELEKTTGWNTSMGAYEKALQYGPGNPEYHYLFGRFYQMFAKAAKDEGIKEMLFQRAWAELEEARKGSPRDARTYLALAQTSEGLGRLGQSASTDSTETWYQRAVSLYPHSAPYRYFLARHYKRAGDVEKALHHVSTMLALDPSADRYIRHHAFWDVPNIDKAAEKALEKALENPFTCNAAAAALAARLAEKKRWLEAAQVYGRQVPESAFADRSGYYIQMGRYLLLGGEERAAEVYFLRALEGASDLFAALRGVKTAYQRAEQLDRLSVLFETLKQGRPEVVEIDLYLAQVLYEQGQYKEALAYLDAFLRVKETSGVDFWMAKTLKALGKDYKAEAYIKQAIRWEPENAQFHHFYAGLLYDRGRFLEALEEADRAIHASHGENAWYLDRKAWILYRMKRYDAAIKAWQRAATLKPAHKAFRRQIDMAKREANGDAVNRLLSY
ncbi:MAG: O-antigen ligase family protein [Thermodesulfobacteriota bacterium]|nr:O-antigen ligase family protein [Thermodesulfobacteriota bacterium]